MEIFINIKTPIYANDKDRSRCSISCDHIYKIKGTYQCTLFNKDVDTGEDDNLGYGFKRTAECLEAEAR
jgi:hypothetical protein